MKWQPGLAEASFIVPEWPRLPSVRAAFTLRNGGVSAPPYAGLNVAAHVGDDAGRVRENRRRLRSQLSLPAEPAWLEQEHGKVVCNLDVSPDWRQPRCADAAVTRQAGKVCVVQVADCLPVLLAALDGTVVGVAHAGWRGLAAGVIEAAVEALRIPGPQLIAWLGPTISAVHFEVGQDVRDTFIAEDADAAAGFTANDRGRWQCDLVRLARQRLTAVGVNAVFGGNWCTYSDTARFFSYRRDGRCGRMAALIWLAPA